MNKYVPYIFLIILVLYFIHAYKKYNTEISILEQNKIALTDTLNVYSAENSSLYEKLVFIKNLRDKDSYIIDSLNQEITILTEQIVSLNNIIIKGSGKIVIDTTIIIENCKGIKIVFTNSNEFYSYTDTIIVDTPPTHNLKLSFNPFSLDSYLTTDKDGRIRTIVSLKGWAKDWLKISDVSTTIDDKFFSKYMKPSPSRLSLFLVGGLQTQPEVYLKGGVGVMWKDNLLLYNYGSNSSHELLYGIKFSLWK